ncbi:MAG: hypothetical protein GXO85_02230 [Chlorobi bacterium]|nr:hypothetical protein [Chlorobiota bacterium]
MKKFIIAIIMLPLLMFVSADIQAQAGNSGSPRTGIQAVQKCHETAGGVQTGFYAVYVYRVGKTDEQTLLGTFKADGTSYTPPAGTITLGSCSSAAGGGGIDSFDYSFQLLPMCDSATYDFNRLIREKCNSLTDVCTTTNVGDYDLSMVAYTLTGTVSAGYCTSNAIYRDMAPDLYEIANTQAFNFDYYSIHIQNVGTKSFTLTMNAATVTILPGGEWWCNAFYNETTKKVEFCPSYTITGTGIEALVSNVTKHTN